MSVFQYKRFPLLYVFYIIHVKAICEEGDRRLPQTDKRVHGSKEE